MRKNVWVMVCAVVSVGLFLALPAGAQAPPNDQNQKTDILPLDGRVEIRPADSYIPPSVMGIQKTINVPAAAFFTDRATAIGAWFHTWSGYLLGTSSSTTYVQAPVYFPKGAKKIIKIDFLLWTDNTGATLYFYMNPFSSDITTLLFSYSPGTYAAWTWFSYAWPKATQPQISPWNQYFLALRLNDEHRIKSVIITYK